VRGAIKGGATGAAGGAALGAIGESDPNLRMNRISIDMSTSIKTHLHSLYDQQTQQLQKLLVSRLPMVPRLVRL